MKANVALSFVTGLMLCNSVGMSLMLMARHEDGGGGGGGGGTPDKLAPALELSAALGGTYLGQQRDGTPRIDVPGQLPQAERHAASLGFDVAAVPHTGYDPIHELIIMFEGDLHLTTGTLAGLPISAVHQDGNFLTVRSDDGFSSEALRQLQDVPGVKYVEPNYPFRLNSIAAPNDPEFQKQWGLKAINAEAGWNQQLTTTVTIAVLDTGVNLAHEDLKSTLWINSNEIPANQIDDDGNGFIDDIHGADFSENDGDPEDTLGHGTHCAGIIGAVANNGVGVAGVARNVSIMAVKILDPIAPETDPRALGSGIAAGIDYAVRNGARILSNSWGGPNNSAAIREALARARAAGVLVVCAAGNGDIFHRGFNLDGRPIFPACYEFDNLISVASVNEQKKRSSFSNFGRRFVHIAAPGENILSTYPYLSAHEPHYLPNNGTSMATPFVAGAAAILWGTEKYGSLEATALRDLLLSKAQKIAGLRDVCAAGGVLDLSFLGKAQVPDRKAAEKPKVLSLDLESSGALGVRVSGKIAADFEIGGETTGATIQPETSTPTLPTRRKYELNFPSDRLRNRAESAMERGQSVTVEGVLHQQSDLQPGWKREPREIIDVRTLSVPGENKQ